MAKLKLVKTEPDPDYDYVELISVYNTELGQEVEIAEGSERARYKYIMCENGPGNGIKLLEIDGEVKLIIKYENAACSDEDLDLYFEDKFPYQSINGELVNVFPIEDIVELAEKIRIYTTNGKEITHLTRGEYFEEGEYDFDIKGEYDFDIKFNKDNFVVVFGTSIFDSIRLTKYVYSYNGKLLSQTEKELDIESLVKNEINDDDSELKQ